VWRRFLTDVAGFADAHDHDFSAPPQSIDDCFHSAIKGTIELRADLFERGQLDVEDFFGFGEIIHRRQNAGMGRRFQSRIGIPPIPKCK